MAKVRIESGVSGMLIRHRESSAQMYPESSTPPDSSRVTGKKILLPQGIPPSKSSPCHPSAPELKVFTTPCGGSAPAPAEQHAAHSHSEVTRKSDPQERFDRCAIRSLLLTFVFRADRVCPPERLPEECGVTGALVVAGNETGNRPSSILRGPLR